MVYEGVVVLGQEKDSVPFRTEEKTRGTGIEVDRTTFESKLYWSDK